MKISCLFLILIFISSCAYRTKGLKAPAESLSSPSISLSRDAEIIYPKEWPKGYPKTYFTIFPDDPSAEWIISKIEYKEAAPQYMCGTGLVLPMVVSFFTLGIIPVQLTDEWKGYVTAKNQKTGFEKRVAFHAKYTSSYSLWNKLKVGKDEEWSKEYTSRETYLRQFIGSKISE